MGLVVGLMGVPAFVVALSLSLAGLGACSEAEAGAPRAATESRLAPRIAVAERLARRLALAAGDTVELRATPTGPGERAVVRAVVADAADPARIADRPLSVLLELPDLARLLGTGETVDRMALRAAPGVSPESLAAEVNRLAHGFRAYTTEEVARESSQAFVVIERFHRAISFVTILGGGVFVMAVMLIKTSEMRRGVGMLRCIGVSRRTLLLAILFEAIALSLIGAAAGIALGGAIAAVVNAHYQRYYDTTLLFARVSVRSAWTAVVVSCVLGLGASLTTGWRMLRQVPLRLVGR